MLRRAAHRPASSSRSSEVSVPAGDQLARGRGGRAVNRRTDSAGPSTASGGITTLTREPSASRASAIGLSSSTRRPTGARMRSIASRSACSDSKRDLGALDPAAALDVDRVVAVDHHLLDLGIGEQLLERAEADRVAQDQLGDLLAPRRREHRGRLVDELAHGRLELGRRASPAAASARRRSTSRSRSSAARTRAWSSAVAMSRSGRGAADLAPAVA